MVASQPQGRIVTFYSYKGGTGRSMALANFAWILAASGKKVLVLDWDLEAPGLHRYFRPFLTDPELADTDGLIDAIWALAGTALETAQATSTPSLNDDYERVVEALEDATRRLRPIDRAADASAAPPARIVKTSRRNSKAPAPRTSLPQLFPSGGSIDLIGAGRQGPTYSVRVNTFGWQRFYELDGARLLDHAKRYLRSTYDWVLIDSRTGVSDTAGICTIQMPDTVVACFTPNRQSVSGVSEVLNWIRSHKSATIDGSAIRFFPVATRIENLEPRKLEASRAYFRGRLGAFLPPDYSSDPRAYWDAMEIPYKTGYAFEELLAAFGDATGALGSADTMLSHMEKMARVIAEDPVLAVGEIVEGEREAVLERYALDESGRDVLSPPAPAPAPPPPDDENDLLRNVRAKEQIWRSSGFNWPYLMSAREIDLLTEKDRGDFGRNMSFYYNQSARMRVFMRSTDRAFLLLLFAPVAIAATYIGWRWGWDGLANLDHPYLRWRALFIYYLSVVGCLTLLALLYNRLPDKPYGLGLAKVMRMIILGPFRAEIRDFEKLDPVPRAGSGPLA
jgi:cellulose biosynthesis protein BcsQ